MNKIYYTKIILVLLFLKLTIISQAQDIHYSQIGNSPMNLNPALTGVFKGDYRFIGNLRRQWNAVPFNYLQFTGQFDTRFTNKKGIQSPFAMGLLYNYDRAGDSKLRMVHLGLQASYTRLMAKNHFVTVGASIAGTQRAFSTDDLHFGDQYDGDTNNQQSAEVFESTNYTYADLSAGINYHVKAPSQFSRSHMNVGVALYHLNQPSKSFDDPLGSDLFRRLSVYGRGIMQVGPKFDLQAHGSGQVQGPHREAIFGFGGILHVRTIPTKETALQFSVSRRLGDAWIVQGGLLYKNWQFYGSYDINTSPFKVATITRGGPEFTLVYIISKLGPMEYCPLCPTYL